MKKTLFILFALIYSAAVPPASADPDKDESGHGRRGYGGYRDYGGEHKEEYWEGGCKVERKWEGSGEYKEERKCPDGPNPYWGNPQPVPPPPGGVMVPSPSVVIQPPPIVIQPHR
jgi:hypothetical protein